MSEISIDEREILVKQVLEEGIVWVGEQLGASGHSSCRRTLRPADLDSIEEAEEAIARPRALMTDDLEARIRSRQRCEGCAGRTKVRCHVKDTETGEQALDDDGKPKWRIETCPDCDGTGRAEGWVE